jgi:hypothetical protein
MASLGWKRVFTKNVIAAIANAKIAVDHHYQRITKRTAKIHADLSRSKISTSTLTNLQKLLGALAEECLKAYLDVTAGMSVEGETLKRLGELLGDIATGQVSSLDVFLKGDLYYRMYSVDPSLQCAKYLSEYIKHLYREPGPLRVLEVGAGTGTTTNTLFEDMRRAGLMPFRRYDFTDISSGFFEQAEIAFAQHARLMNFKVFNAENCAKAQGFEEGAYDLVIGANVIHATRRMNETLDNARLLLNPGG